MKRVSLLFLSLLAVIAVSCGPQKSADQAPADSTQVAQAQPNLDEIKAMLEQAQMDYAKAWCNKDTTFMIENWAHDDDITIWGPAAAGRVQGWEGPNGVKKWYWDSFDGAKEINFTFTDLLIKVAQDGNSAVITYNVHNEYTDLSGKKTIMTPRVSVVKERRGDKWVQIHGDASYSISQVKELKLYK
jgi:ketosteroid isomerase-like protein